MVVFSQSSDNLKQHVTLKRFVSWIYTKPQNVSQHVFLTIIIDAYLINENKVKTLSDGTNTYENISSNCFEKETL